MSRMLVLESSQDSTEARSFAWALSLIAALALLWRLMAVAAAPVLANDEAALAWSFETRSFAELLRPLEFGQGAPVLFIAAAKMAELLLGPSTWAYRLFPLVCGCLAVIWIGLLSRRLFPAPIAIGTAALAAFGGTMIQYAAFFKQYSSDVLVSAVLLWCIVGLARRVRASADQAYRWGAFAALCVVAPWLSHPAIFVIAGSGGALLVCLLAGRQNAIASTLSWVLAATLASFAVHYFAFATHLNDSAFLREFWAPQMMPSPITPGAVVKWLVRSGSDLSSTSLGIPGGWEWARISALAALAIMLLGLGAIWRDDRLVATILILPLALALGAAAVRMYPFSGRLLLFALPASLVLLTAGVSTVLRHRGATTAALVGIAFLMAVTGLRVNDTQHVHARFADTCRALAPNVGPRDHVYIFYPNRFVCYYALVHASVDSKQITPGAGDSQGAFEAVHKVESELASLNLNSWQTVWFVQSYPRTRDGRDEGDVPLNYFRRRCTEHSTEQLGESRLVRFSCTRDSSHS